MPDKTLTCSDCGEDFVFTEAMEKNLHKLVQEGKIETYNEPKRCHPCRLAKKQRHKTRR